MSVISNSQCVLPHNFSRVLITDVVLTCIGFTLNYQIFISQRLLAHELYTQRLVFTTSLILSHNLHSGMVVMTLDHCMLSQLDYYMYTSMAATLLVNLVYPGSPTSTQVHPLTGLNGMHSRLYVGHPFITVSFRSCSVVSSLVASFISPILTGMLHLLSADSRVVL